MTRAFAVPVGTVLVDGAGMLLRVVGYKSDRRERTYMLQFVDVARSEHGI